MATKDVQWNKLFDLTSVLIKLVVSEVPRIEQIVQTIPQLKDLTGAEKKAAVLSIVQGALTIVEDVADKDLVNDADVMTAAGGIIDAVVALQNIVAAKKAEALPNAQAG